MFEKLWDLEGLRMPISIGFPKELGGPQNLIVDQVFSECHFEASLLDQSWHILAMFGNGEHEDVWHRFPVPRQGKDQ